MSTPHANTILFARGMLARLALWPTLRLAVQASWGGPASSEKQRWVASVLVDQFEPFLVPPAAAPSTSSPPDAVYVEELLLQIMVDEFEVELEDGSAGVIAKDVVKLFATICAGDESFVHELEAQVETFKGTTPQYEMSMGSEGESSDSGSEDEWEDEESEGESAPQLLNESEPRTREEAQVDEDGFTMVKKKGRR